MSRLTHFDAAGKAAMVDVGEKAVTERSATAAGSVFLSPEAFRLVAEGKAGKGHGDRPEAGTVSPGTVSAVALVHHHGLHDRVSWLPSCRFGCRILPPIRRKGLQHRSGPHPENRRNGRRVTSSCKLNTESQRPAVGDSRHFISTDALIRTQSALNFQSGETDERR